MVREQDGRKRVHVLIEKVKALRREGYDLVERAGKLQLPLILSDGESFNYAFTCAVAELTVIYEGSFQDLEIILESYFDPKTIRRSFLRRDGAIDFLTNERPPPLTKKRIIAIAYPWYNQWLYFDLARISRVFNIDVKSYLSLTGKYRYFRTFPITSHRFRLADGYIQIAIDRDRNMICFGDKSRSYRLDDIFEHRGFVLPNDSGKIILLGFREGVVRTAIIGRSQRSELQGILATATRQSGRPFASRFIMVRQGSSPLYDLDIPLSRSDPNEFDPRSKEYSALMQRIEELNQDTIFPSEGFMWGDGDRPW